MRQPAYLRYLEILALSAMQNLSDKDQISEIGEPNIKYCVYNARECIDQHRKARAGLMEVHGVEPDTVDDVIRKERNLTPQEKEAKKLQRLRDSLNQALEMIADIRYREWPKGSDKTLGLDAEKMDMLLHEGELAIAYSKRKIT